VKALFCRPILTCLILLVGSSAFAGSLCQTRWSEFQTKLAKSENRLAFVNQPGPMKIGMCWWHSRMQRNANFLLEFRPQSAATGNDGVWQIIKNLSRTDKVQVVPGFANLQAFSARYSSEMNESMGQWQMSDSFLKFGWANGLGSGESDAGTLSREMDALYEDVMIKRNVTYQMLKMPGFEAHAWLVLNMTKLAGNQGYQLTVIDSNAYSPQYYLYTRGMTKFIYRINGFEQRGMDFVPHTQRDSDFADYQSALNQACGRR
jgi:hypothetical protein